MRYVGRHREPRPLLLRRPVVGGVAAAVILAVPLLYVTGNFGEGIQGSTPLSIIADGLKKGSKPAGTKTGSAAVVIPTDGSAIPKRGSQGQANPGQGAAGIGVGNGVGVGVEVGDSNEAVVSPTAGPTRIPGATPTKPPVSPTKPPATSAKPPASPTNPPTTPPKPPADPTKPPADPTKPPADPTKPPADPTKPPADPPKTPETPKSPESTGTPKPRQ